MRKPRPSKKNPRNQRNTSRRPQRQREQDAGVQYTLEDAPRADLRIDAIAWGGDAIATAPDGRIVFIDQGFPGQQVRVAITEEKKRFLRATVLDVLEDPTENAPACPTHKLCGGCRFQGVAYDQELVWKTDALKNMLTRLGGNLRWPELTVVPDHSAAHYRTRVRLRVDDQGRTGYLARGSHDFVPAIRCDILHPALEEARNYAGALAANLPSVHTVRLELDEVRGHVLIEIPCALEEWKTVRLRVRERLETLAVPSVEIEGKTMQFSVTMRHRGRCEALLGDGTIVRNYAPVLVTQKSGQFAQANGRLNVALREKVADWITEDWSRKDGIQYVVDLFSGAGNLAFATAARGTRVVAIDHASEAIDDGEAANPATGIARVVRWVSADLANGPFVPLEEHLSSAHAFVVDPPRGGLSAELIQEIAQQRAKTMVYVSCDPAAFARDAVRMAKYGWRVQKLEAWDMFPRTAHVELLAKLTRGV